MIKKFMKLLAITFLLQASTLFAAEANYVNLFDKLESSVGVGIDEVRIGDVASHSTRCAASEKFVCVLSKVFVFSIPKDIESNDHWKHAGASYKVMYKKEIVIRGEIVEYRVIRQKLKNTIIDYAYSTDYGVLVIKGKNGHEMSLLEKCGFAATSNKKGCLAPE